MNPRASKSDALPAATITVGAETFRIAANTRALALEWFRSVSPTRPSENNASVRVEAVALGCAFAAVIPPARHE
jgi:hypothetical protein